MAELVVTAPSAFGQARTAFVAPNDQPWSQPFRFWLDEARTQPLTLTGAGGWLQWPGGSARVVLDAPVSGNVATLALAQADIAALRLGTWWGELQFETGGDTVGSLRFDLKIAAGSGTGLGATKAMCATQDVIICDTGPIDVVLLPVGPGAAQYITLSQQAQAYIQQHTGDQVATVEAALCALARRFAILNGTDPDQATIFSTT